MRTVGGKRVDKTIGGILSVLGRLGLGLAFAEVNFTAVFVGFGSGAASVKMTSCQPATGPLELVKRYWLLMTSTAAAGPVAPSAGRNVTATTGVELVIVPKTGRRAASCEQPAAAAISRTAPQRAKTLF